MLDLVTKDDMKKALDNFTFKLTVYVGLEIVAFTLAVLLILRHALGGQ